MNPQALKGSVSLLVAAMLLASTSAFADVAQQVKAPTIAKELQQAKTYTISSPPTAPLEMPKPALPDLSGYTAAAMEKKVVRTKPGKVSVRRMMQEDALKDFIGGDNKMAEWVVRSRRYPSASRPTPAQPVTPPRLPIAVAPECARARYHHSRPVRRPGPLR